MSAAAPSSIKQSPGSPPGPKGHFLLGNLAAVSSDWLGFYSRCAKEYGDVVQLRYVHVPICLVMHPRDIEYVLVTNPGNFTKSADYRALARVLGNGLLTNEGKAWQHQRSLIQPAFRRENILSYGPVMTSATRQLLDAWTDGESRNVHEDMMALTCETPRYQRLKQNHPKYSSGTPRFESGARRPTRCTTPGSRRRR